MCVGPAGKRACVRACGRHTRVLDHQMCVCVHPVFELSVCACVLVFVYVCVWSSVHEYCVCVCVCCSDITNDQLGISGETDAVA